MKISFFIFALLFPFCQSNAQDKNQPPDIQHVHYLPKPTPSRIILSWEADPSSSATVTWRTDASIGRAKAEITLADPSPYFNDYEKDIPATTSSVPTSNGPALYHKVQFKNLQPETPYLYRVGDGTYWSEWFQFTTASKNKQSFKFIYMGDAQNKVFSHWSRVIRAAYARAPNAGFILHVGDLINHADNNYEWEEWFRAGSFIHATMPTLVLPGNHEYNKNESGFKESFSKFWQPQFNYFKNAPLDTLQDQAYYFDYQHTRFIILNSNQFWQEQALWLDRVLSESKQTWNILAFHHPIRNAVVGRQNKEVVQYWQPIIAKHQVDMILQGHDHTYARGFLDKEQNGALYLVSVGGEKMYELTEQEWMQRKGENTQLYQVLEINGNELLYQCYTPDGKIYDTFILAKNKDKKNVLVELKNDYPEERRNSNTLQEK
ncbi:MAG: fibronectin type III domain-containing protein [Cyclobacteriaceae bacterium]